MRVRRRFTREMKPYVAAAFAALAVDAQSVLAAPPNVTVTVQSGELSAAASASISGSGGTELDSRSLGPADFPNASGSFEVIVAPSDTGGLPGTQGIGANSNARLSVGSFVGGDTVVVEVNISANANTSCFFANEQPSATATAAGSSVVLVEIQVDAEVEFEVEVAARSVAAISNSTPGSPPTASGLIQLALGEASLVGVSVQGNEEREVLETGRLSPGVTYRLQANLAAGGTTLSGCGTSGGKGALANIFATLALQPTNDAVRWINPAGGSFGVAGNWDPALVPGAEDRAIFELAASYGVQLGGSRTVASALVRSSLLDLVDGTLALTGPSSLALGDGARLTLQDATLQPVDVVIGDTAFGARSALRVPLGGALAASGSLRVGDRAPGVLELTGGTVTAGQAVVGGPEDVEAPSLVHGRVRTTSSQDLDPLRELAGGKIRVLGGAATFDGLTVGASGSAYVDVRGGGLLRTLGVARVGVAPGPGAAEVFGAEASDAIVNWQSEGALIIGDDAFGVFEIFAGGSATAATAKLGTGPAGDGVLNVSGTGPDGVRSSRFDVSRRLVVGDGGAGTLVVFDSAAATAFDLWIAGEFDGEGLVQVVDGSLSVDDVLAVGVPGAGKLEVGVAGRVTCRHLSVASFKPLLPSIVPSFVDVTGGIIDATEAIVIGAIDSENGTRGGVGSVQVTAGGKVSVEGPDGQILIANGEMVVEGVDTKANAHQIAVLGGVLDVRDGARAETTNLFAVGAPSSDSEVAVSDAFVHVIDTLTVGDETDRSLTGAMRLAGTAVADVDRELFVGPGGALTGVGTIKVGELVTMRGTVAPGVLLLLGELSRDAAAPALTSTTAFTNDPLIFEADVMLESTAVVQLPVTVAGNDVRLRVTEDLTLDGTLEVLVAEGYLPKAGDALGVIEVGGALTGSFAELRVRGVGEGFVFSFDPETGAVTAENDATPCEAGDLDDDGILDCPAVQSCCGDPNGDAKVTAQDALAVLLGAVGQQACDTCCCDVDSSGGVTATDALRVLRAAVGEPIALNCPVCG